MASHYVKNVISKDSAWEYWDWRDCKEKGNRIHSKVTSAIERLTGGAITATQLADESFADLVDYLFSSLADRRIVFVFDNIDAYVELENFQLTGAMDVLYQAALNNSHNSQFIFTCRTSINDIHVELLVIKLQGLSEVDTLTLFNSYSLPLTKTQIEQLSGSSFTLTKGHPLWLNLIAAQARKGADAVNNFLNGIKGNTTFAEESISSILSDKILRVIWENLNENQKELLQALAENVKAENEQNLSRIVDPIMSGNRFFKAFKSLKQLNLIVTKSKPGEADTFELHPLVKEFIVQNFARSERSKYIILLVKFYDTVIALLKPNINPNQPLSFFENWTAKVELSINNEDYKSALSSLHDVWDAISESGYTEEYIRVAALLFIAIDWAQAIQEEYSYFHEELRNFIEALTDYGRYNEADDYLTRYQRYLPNKNNHYIRYLRVKSYFYWFQSDFEKAIEVAREAVELDKENSNKVGLILQNTLALALRDTRTGENIREALNLFLESKTLDYIISEPVDADASGEMYGNVGRCLQYLGELDNALTCYAKALSKSLFVINKGYAYFWVAEVLVEKNLMLTAAWFYKMASITWGPVSPIKSLLVNKKLDAIIEIFQPASQAEKANANEVAKQCNSFLSTIYK